MSERFYQSTLPYSSGRDDWETPIDLFKELDAEFHFTLDACALSQNALCSRYYTPEDDGLKQDWAGETVFCNPPYSRGAQSAWVRKAYEETQKPNTTVVMLIPARTDTDRFHKYVFGKAEVRWIRGRLKFKLDGQEQCDSKGNPVGAPFPSCIVIFSSRGGDSNGK